MWNEKEKHINTDYAVTDCMLCVIPHIREDVFKNAQNKHNIQVNTVIKSLSAGSTEKELHETIDTFWSEYKNSIIRMIFLTVMILSGTVKILVMSIVICGIRNTLYHPPKSFVF